MSRKTFLTVMIYIYYYLLITLYRASSAIYLRDDWGFAFGTKLQLQPTHTSCKISTII